MNLLKIQDRDTNQYIAEQYIAAIYWYCQYQYQYWFLSNCNININIEILLAIYCQYQYNKYQYIAAINISNIQAISIYCQYQYFWYIAKVTLSICFSNILILPISILKYCKQYIADKFPETYRASAACSCDFIEASETSRFIAFCNDE